MYIYQLHIRKETNYTDLCTYCSLFLLILCFFLFFSYLYVYFLFELHLFIVVAVAGDDGVMQLQLRLLSVDAFSSGWLYFNNTTHK